MLLLSSPATGLFVKRLTGLRRRMLLETDSRVKLMNQLLVGIRVLKLYAWEAAQEAAVSALQLMCSAVVESSGVITDTVLAAVACQCGTSVNLLHQDSHICTMCPGA